VTTVLRSLTILVLAVVWSSCEGEEAESVGQCRCAVPVDPAPEAAEWDDFFHTCDHAPEQCGVMGEVCEAERCLLPCESDNDCPTLSVPAWTCGEGELTSEDVDQHVACVAAIAQLAREDAGMVETETLLQLTCVDQGNGKRCLPMAE
jgi:hypothetical protein